MLKQKAAELMEQSRLKKEKEREIQERVAFYASLREEQVESRQVKAASQQEHRKEAQIKERREKQAKLRE